MTVDGSAISASDMNAENSGVVCYASGTLIKTLRGDIAIEDLCVGDLVITRDNGPQQILWTGHKVLTPEMLKHAPNLKPIRLSARVYNLERDLIISPQHGILLRDPQRGGA